MPYRWIDGLTSADLALEATGLDLAELFRSAWEATARAMLGEGGLPAAGEERSLELRAASPEELLLETLEKVVFVKDAEGILLLPGSVAVAEEAGLARLQARARGVRVEAVADRLEADVKAVTLHRFSLSRQAGRWVATVVLDV